MSMIAHLVVSEGMVGGIWRLRHVQQRCFLDLIESPRALSMSIHSTRDSSLSSVAPYLTIWINKVVVMNMLFFITARTVHTIAYICKRVLSKRVSIILCFILETYFSKYHFYIYKKLNVIFRRIISRSIFPP